MDQAQQIIELVLGLEPESQQEVLTFVEAVVAKQHRRKASPIFDWADSLTELPGKYSSVDLQHQISRGRERLPRL
jgi:hypothetical protein